jgi:uncharacterized protein YkwD
MADSIPGLKWYVDWDSAAYEVAKDHVEYMSTTDDVSHDQDTLLGFLYNIEVEPVFYKRFAKHSIDSGSYVTESIQSIMIDSIWRNEEPTEDMLADRIVQNWINSPSHREMLLDTVFVLGAIYHIIVDEQEKVWWYDDGTADFYKVSKTIYVAYEGYLE